MYRHVSAFTLRNKEEIDSFINLLHEVANKCSLIQNSEVGKNISAPPPVGPDFADVIQIIDFNTKEDLDLYPSSKQHQKLLVDGPEMIKVTAIDYII